MTNLISMLNLNLIPKSNQTVLTQEVENELLILDRNDNKVHQLNETALLIWKECDGIQSIQDIVEIFVNNYEVTHDKAEKDVLETLRILQENNLIEI